MNIEIANELVRLRKERGFSQEELAEKIGVSRQAVSKWERAESSPDTDNLIALAKLYGISLDELLFISGGKSRVSPAVAGRVSDADPRNCEQEDSRKGGMFLFPYPVVAVILFFVFIFTNTGWGFSWLIFLTVPIYYGIAEMIYQRKRNSVEKTNKMKNDKTDDGDGE